MTDPTVDEVIEVARTYRNVVLEGPPGTGKTHLVGQVAARWQELTGRPLGGDARGRWALTLHPSTGYEDFVEGVRADEQGHFRLRKGFLRRCVEDARKHPEQDFLVLLDELNRANVPRVLGDALLAVEASKRLRHDGTDWTGGGLEVTLPYSQVAFGIPDNLYFLATMNTTDRSVASLDSALRRRFAFVRLPPLGPDALLEALPEAARATLAPSVRTLGLLNEDLLQPVLGADSALGHSYLFDAAAALGGPDPTSGLAQELRDRATADGAAFTDAFWLEVGEGTSGSGHQVDLPLAGRADVSAGPVNAFFPGVQGRLSTSEERRLDIHFEGRTYRGCRLWFAANNGSWRLALNGQADDRDKLSGYGKTHVQRHVLAFLRLGDDHYALRSLPLDTIPVLETWGRHDQAKGSPRRFGRFDGTVPTAPVDAAVRRAWQYALLPQLVDVVSAQGAEALLTSERAQLL